MRIEERDMQQLASPLVMGYGKWLHAFELRFLLSEGAYFPPPEKFKKKNRAFLINVPDNSALILNLLVGNEGSSATTDLPTEFLPAAKIIWRVGLRNQRPVILISRVLGMDAQYRYQVMRIRQEIRPTVTVDTSSQIPKSYLETTNFSWHQTGGNVIVVVPMGKEAFRARDEPTSQASASCAIDSRAITVTSPSASIPILAPNRTVVGSLSITGATSEVIVTKGVELRCSFGTATLSLNPVNLIFGESFQTPRSLCKCVPTIDCGQPLNWTYSVYSSFDGSTLKVAIRKISVALRNANLPAPMQHVKNDEEIVMGAPADELILKASASTPTVSTQLNATLLLRNI
jgi:hypothetical protein